MKYTKKVTWINPILSKFFTIASYLVYIYIQIYILYTVTSKNAILNLPKKKAAFFFLRHCAWVSTKKGNGGQGANQSSDTGIRPVRRLSNLQDAKRDQTEKNRPLRGAANQRKRLLKNQSFWWLFFLVLQLFLEVVTSWVLCCCEWRCPNGESPQCSSRMFQTADLYVFLRIGKARDTCEDVPDF